MRLINTTSLQFEEFFDSNIPKYAILSHRWGEKEITFQKLEEGKDLEGPGYEKITRSCSLAKDRGLDWVWIDTCCIDKKSSAELSEAINSMYRWYAQAQECYAYLSDVRWVQSEDGSWEDSRQKFRNSAWFTRGWTLQELLAPLEVTFFDRQWEIISSYNRGISYGQDTLEELISAATGINPQYLTSPEDANVATKMSWASKRETSRAEDMAYCLLGLFDVNMPLLYGEGRKAFLRLQLEIIKMSDDESIFAWTADRSLSGLLASWPTAFAQSGSVRNNCVLLEERPPYFMTNKGLEITVHSDQNRHSNKYVTFPLACQEVNDETEVIAIRLCKFMTYYYRTECNKLLKVPSATIGNYKNLIPLYIRDG